MFQLDFASRVPIYEQIFENVIKLASVGVFNPGDKLPPVRTLASQLGINPNTVAKSYRMLELSGYIFSTVGRGSFLTDKLSMDSAQKILAIEEYKKSIRGVRIYGVEREELIQIMDDVLKGGMKDD